MAKELNTMVDEFRTRPLDQGPYFYKHLQPIAQFSRLVRGGGWGKTRRGSPYGALG